MSRSSVSTCLRQTVANDLLIASEIQVYKGVLKKEGTTVAVKVQRPYVLETVSLDLYLLREAATLASKV